MRKLTAVVMIIIISLFLVACGSDENKAKKAAEGYMDSVRLGDDHDYLFPGVDGFIDLFEYEYLQTLDAPEEKETRELSRRRYELFGDDYSSFEEYKKEEKEFYEFLGYTEVLTEDNDTLILWDGETYKDLYKFLYNVEIADEFGQKLYKKTEITIEKRTAIDENDERYDEFTVVDIYLR